MKIAVTGWEGKVGSELIKRGYEPLKCNITKLDEVNSEISKVEPDVIVHCAALTDVGYCESHEREAFAVNVSGVHNILHDFTGTLIYLSSVHVFDGNKYWDYSEKHVPNPVNVYGLTKLAGEQIAKFHIGRTIIVRISRIFDYNSMKPEIDTLKAGKSLEFTTLIKRSFQYLPHFADNLVWLINEMDNFPDMNLLNIAGTDTLNYYDFWLQACNVLGLDTQLLIPRTYKIKDHPRPFRGGLNLRRAKKLGMETYSALDGLKVMKELL